MAPPPIAYIVPSRIPGIAANSVQVMKMAAALMARFPDLLMVAGRGEPTGQDLRTLYGVARLPQAVHLPIAGRFGPHLFGLRAAALVRRRGARIVLTRSIVAAAFASLLGMTTIFECHTPPSGAEKLYWRILARARRLRVVVISEALRRIMTERHPEMRRLDVVVAHDGVDLARFADLPAAEDAKALAGRDPRRPVAGYAGHLYAGRGVEVILDCARRRPDWDFVLIGGTPADVERWRDEAAKGELSNVAFTGFLPNAALPSALAACDVLLMPYQRELSISGGGLNTAAWMSPLKMFEYLAMGRAIVASDLPVLREVLRDDNAVLVQPDDVAGWVAALDGLADPARRRALAAGARATAAGYDWSARVARILADIAPSSQAAAQAPQDTNPRSSTPR